MGRIRNGIVPLFLVVMLIGGVGFAAAHTGVVAFDEDGVAFDAPSFPDWWYIWEVPTEEPPDREPRSNDDVGDQVTTDPNTTSADTSAATVESDAIEAAIHDLVNEHREDHDAGVVDHDGAIASMARTHSHDMATRDYFSHMSPEGDGPHDRMDAMFPSDCRAVGENLAMVRSVGVTTDEELAERIVEGWLESDDHRENMLHNRWDRQGIGIYLANDTAWATQKFCQDR